MGLACAGLTDHRNDAIVGGITTEERVEHLMLGYRCSTIGAATANVLAEHPRGR